MIRPGDETREGREKRRALLDFLRREHAAYGTFPTLKQMAAAIGTSRQVAGYHVDRLTAAGDVLVRFCPKTGRILQRYLAARHRTGA